MIDTVVNLVAETPGNKNKYGVISTEKTVKEVFCKLESVTRSEFFGGGRNGLNPQYKLIMFSGDYEGEPTVIYNDLPYSVYRTFQPSMDVIELYVERKGGTNGVKEN